MHGAFPPFNELYGREQDRRLAYHAACVEAEGYRRWTRIREVAELSRRMGFRRLAMAHCPDTRREAELTARYVRARGFELVLPPSSVDCDPIGQAHLFNEQNADFVVVAGMCVGHDALLVRHVQAPVTSLVVRDLRLRHNPAGALYASYLVDELTPSRARERPEVPPPAWDDELLDRRAREVGEESARRRSVPPCRIEEIIDFARRSGAWHLGLVYCSGFRAEARQLAAILRPHGFRVSSVCCKSGAVPKERLGLANAQKVRPGQPEMICNAPAQAELLDRNHVDLVLLMGQCVGHDSATISRLRTPMVFVVAKDRVLAHNTVAALCR
jgi:uncharacterized metal-binding protein